MFFWAVVFLCSAIYDSLHKSKRDDLWDDLGVLSGIDEAWIFFGNFNVILNVGEWQGGQ